MIPFRNAPAADKLEGPASGESGICTQTFQDGFPSLGHAEIQARGGRDQGRTGFVVQTARRLELDLHLSRIGHRRIGPIERTECEGRCCCPDQIEEGDG